MSGKFEIGDTVQLKSGGPKMSVTNVGTHRVTKKPTVICAWFVNDKVEKSDFPPEALQLVK